MTRPSGRPVCVSQRYAGSTAKVTARTTPACPSTRWRAGRRASSRLARDPLERHRRAGQDAAGLRGELGHVPACLIFQRPRHLLDDELRVQPHVQHGIRIDLERPAHAGDHAVVLGDVVGRDADVDADLGEHLTGGRVDHHASRRPRRRGCRAIRRRPRRSSSRGVDVTVRTPRCAPGPRSSRGRAARRRAPPRAPCSCRTSSAPPRSRCETPPRRCEAPTP